MAPYWGLKGSKLQAAIWAEAFVLVAIFGYNQSVAGGVLTTRSFSNQFPQMDVIDAKGAEKAHNSTIQGTVIAIYTLTGMFGAIACIIFGDLIGRRWALWLSCLFSGLGSLLMCSAFSFGQFIAARIVLGLGTGGIIATTSVWQSELSKASSRGSHVSAFGTFVVTGIILALWIDFGTASLSSSFSWRFPLGFPLVLCIVALSTIFTLPESPRWLVKKGKTDEARDILRLLHMDSQVVDQELGDILTSLSISGQSQGWRSMLQMGEQRVFHRVALACTVQIMLQMTGINVVAFYTSSLYVLELGFQPREAEILAAASQFCAIIGCGLASFTVDRYGRRTLMMTSAASMSVCLAVLTGLISNPDNKIALKVAVVFVWLYQLVYTLGFLGIPFLYASEVAPAKQRAAICGFSTAVSWLFNFLVVEITPIAFTNLGWRYFIIYSILNAVCVPIIYFFFPETNGHKLEEIDAIFIASKSIFDPVRISKAPPVETLVEFAISAGLETNVQQTQESDATKSAAEHIEARAVE